jgi:GMP synthase (glutamine-hydrolysing)
MKEQETLIILDYGSQYTQLIARRAREMGVFSLILPFSTELAEIKKHNPKSIILSGGPSGVYEKDAPKLELGLLDLGLPILGVCYGLQLLALNLGGKVESSNSREYGLSKLEVKASASKLLKKDYDDSKIWLSHGDHVAKAPEDFEVTAYSNGIISGVESPEKQIYGIQFHPEVYHTEFGTEIIKNFLVDICGYSQDWTPESFVETEIKKIQDAVGDGNVVCALSGGVDSSVAATLVNAAVGSKQTCIFVDTGLLRKDEYEEVLGIYEKTGLNVKPIRAEERFLAKLAGVTDPEQKRKIIGNEFIEIFDEEAKKLGNVKYLVQGTLYPDVIESVSVKGPSVTIKSHHNVGGLPEKMNLKLIEPLRELFKDEVRRIGGELGLPENVTGRQPFPGPGLAIRIIGEINKTATSLLKETDSIVREEVISAGLAKDLWQYFAVLLPIKSVGVMGDDRTYEQVIAIRVVESMDGMTADWAKLPYGVLEKISSRIIREVRGINRVVYDITSKPPGTIEWE